MLGTGRLEAFSDGVLAIIITIMVLEMKVPHGAGFAELQPLLPVFLSYVLSFVNLGIYWNNHHHLLRATERVSGGVLWANLHLLFWLSLVPFVTGWMGENSFAPVPTALYGGVLLLAAIAYWLLQRSILAEQGRDSLLAAAVGRDLKGKLSPVLYVIAIPVALWKPWIAGAIYVAVALMWLVPDPRIERALAGGRVPARGRPTDRVTPARTPKSGAFGMLGGAAHDRRTPSTDRPAHAPNPLAPSFRPPPPGRVRRHDLTACTGGR